MVTKLYTFPLFVVIAIFVIWTTFAAAKCTPSERIYGECPEDDDWDSDYIDGDYSYDPREIYNGEKCQKEVAKKCIRQVYDGEIDNYCCEKIFELGEECSKKMFKCLVEKLLKRQVKNNDKIKKRIRKRAKLAYEKCKRDVRAH